MFKKKKQNIRKSRNAIMVSNTPFAYAESYKSLRANLEFSTFDGEVKTILFTSSIPNEGKSSVAINTATTLAENGYKVLLIDADLRSPSVGSYLRVRGQNTKGLSTVLSGQSQIKESIYSYALSNFDVILSGPIPPNPAELLSHKKFEMLLEALKNEYDYILVDTPPVGVVADAALIGRIVDGAIYVVRHNFTNKDTAKEALKKLKSSNVSVLGTVLNDYYIDKDITASEHYEYYYYNAGSIKND